MIRSTHATRLRVKPDRPAWRFGSSRGPIDPRMRFDQRLPAPTSALRRPPKYLPGGRQQLSNLTTAIASAPRQDGSAT